MTSRERAAALAVMARHGVLDCRRAVPADVTEEVLLLTPESLASLDVDAVTRELMAVLPHRKVWVVTDSNKWTSEPLSLDR